MTLKVSVKPLNGQVHILVEGYDSHVFTETYRRDAMRACEKLMYRILVGVQPRQRQNSKTSVSMFYAFQVQLAPNKLADVCLRLQPTLQHFWVMHEDSSREQGYTISRIRQSRERKSA